MIYGKEHEETGVKLERDCYAEQFAEPGDIKFNYIVSLNGDCIDECSDRRKLGRRLRKVAMRLLMVANFLEGRK